MAIVELNKVTEQDDGAEALQARSNTGSLQDTSKLTTRALDNTMRTLLTSAWT